MVAKIVPTVEGYVTIGIYNKHGTLITNIAPATIQKDGGSIQTYNRDGKTIFDTSPSLDGDGSLGIYNRDGKLLINMAPNTAGNGSIDFFKVDGTHIRK